MLQKNAADIKIVLRNLSGFFLAVTSTGPRGVMVLWLLCPGAPGGSPVSDSIWFKTSQKTWPRVKVLSHKLVEPVVELETPGSKCLVQGNNLV